MAKKRAKREPKKLSIDVIEARAIVLVDEYGIERANLFCTGGDAGKGGMTVVQINDDNGRPRLELQVDPSGNPAIRLATPNDGSGVSLAVNEVGNGMSIGDFEGKTCIMLGVPHPDSDDPRGPHPDIHVFDEDTGRQWSAFNGEYVAPTPERSKDAEDAT